MGGNTKPKIKQTQLIDEKRKKKLMKKLMKIKLDQSMQMRKPLNASLHQAKLCKLQRNNSELARALAEERQQSKTWYAKSATLERELIDTQESLNRCRFKENEIMDEVENQIKEVLVPLNSAVNSCLENASALIGHLETIKIITVSLKKQAIKPRQSSIVLSRSSAKSPVKNVVHPMVQGMVLQPFSISISRVDLEQRRRNRLQDMTERFESESGMESIAENPTTVSDIEINSTTDPGLNVSPVPPQDLPVETPLALTASNPDPLDTAVASVENCSPVVKGRKSIKNQSNEDPLEGASWMFNSSGRKRTKPRRKASNSSPPPHAIFESDSDSDEPETKSSVPLPKRRRVGRSSTKRKSITGIGKRTKCSPSKERTLSLPSSDETITSSDQNVDDLYSVNLRTLAPFVTKRSRKRSTADSRSLSEFSHHSVKCDPDIIDSLSFPSPSFIESIDVANFVDEKSSDRLFERKPNADSEPENDSYQNVTRDFKTEKISPEEISPNVTEEISPNVTNTMNVPMDMTACIPCKVKIHPISVSERILNLSPPIDSLPQNAKTRQCLVDISIKDKPIADNLNKNVKSKRFFKSPDQKEEPPKRPRRKEGRIYDYSLIDNTLIDDIPARIVCKENIPPFVNKNETAIVNNHVISSCVMKDVSIIVEDIMKSPSDVFSSPALRQFVSKERVSRGKVSQRTPKEKAVRKTKINYKSFKLSPTFYSAKKKSLDKPSKKNSKKGADDHCSNQMNSARTRRKKSIVDYMESPENSPTLKSDFFGFKPEEVYLDDVQEDTADSPSVKFPFSEAVPQIESVSAVVSSIKSEPVDVLCFDSSPKAVTENSLMEEIDNSVDKKPRRAALKIASFKEPSLVSKLRRETPGKKNKKRK